MFLNFSIYCPESNEANGTSTAAPGECYWYKSFQRYKVGILLHLVGVLSAGLLAVFQFTPFIRHKWIMIHRVTGYASLLLYIVGTAGAFMIARHAFGGGLDVQLWVYFIGFSTLVCFAISYINIKKLQIEQHRAWMLRGWFYVCSLIALFQVRSLIV